MQSAGLVIGTLVSLVLLALIAYGWSQTLQDSSFGRLYAVYGGYFIVLSLLWGWALDGHRPDTGDVVGGAIARGCTCDVLLAKELFLENTAGRITLIH